MANPHKGEVELKAGDVSYTLRFSIDAICGLEERLGKGFPELAGDLSDAKKISLTLVREWLYASLREGHPELSLKEAGELIPAAGGLTEVMGRVSDAIAAAFPQVEASGTPRPLKGARAGGTGQAS